MLMSTAPYKTASKTMQPATIPAAYPASKNAARKVRFWNRNAARYARSPIADMRGYERTLERVQALLAPTDEVLELGCGTGTTALRLAPHVHRLVATDVSPDMIAIAQGKLASQPIPQLEFRLADADRPQTAEGEFDAVLAFNLLHLVDDLDQTLGGAVRALRPGGLLISKTPCLMDMNPLIPKFAVPLMQAVGLAPPVLCFAADTLTAAFQRQGLTIEALERHGTKGRDFRLFLVARKPATVCSFAATPPSGGRPDGPGL